MPRARALAYHLAKCGSTRVVDSQAATAAERANGHAAAIVNEEG